MAESNHKFVSLADTARSEWGGAAKSKLLGGSNEGTPRFELYNAGLSVCSQKVRTVLAEKQAGYLSNEMSIISGKGIYSEEFSIAENYRPNYVRLRSYGAGEALMKNLATGHTMGSSVKTEGFDACVVPTLVDHQNEKVIVDSTRICAYLEQEVSTGTTLIPSGLEEAIDRQIEIVDGIPMGAILYGFLENDPRPDFLKMAMDGVYDVKRQALEMLIEENKNDEELVATYQAKISKEMAGKDLYKNIDYLNGKMADFASIIEKLDAELQHSDGLWIHGDAFTLSDAFWGVSLYRIHWVGHAQLWQNRPRVKAYAHRLYTRSSLLSEVINFPSPMPPSKHTADIEGVL